MSSRFAVAILMLAWYGHPAMAHHTYSMFDGSALKSISGTVASLEWKNPHIHVWVYVPSSANPGTYDLWTFENGSPSVLSARGWDKNSLKAGDKVSIEFYPLRNGGMGGHLDRATFPDGRVLIGAPGPLSR